LNIFLINYGINKSTNIMTYRTFDGTSQAETITDGRFSSEGTQYLKDAESLNLGTSKDLVISHDGSDSIINDAGTGNLKLQVGGSTIVETASTGATITGTTTVDKVIYNKGAELTIASGVIAVTHSYHEVDTEGDAATDDLATINGGVEGQRLILRAADSGRTINIVQGGNIELTQNPRTLTHKDDNITLIYDGSDWLEVSYMNSSLGTELTIASGAITVTNDYHKVDTEGDASSDDLVTINGGSKGQLLTLCAQNNARTIKCKTSGNLRLQMGSEVWLDNTTDTITFVYNGTNWLQVAATDNDTTGAELTISSGVIEVSTNYHIVDTEGDAASDDLDTINGGKLGQLLTLVVADGARTVVMKDGTGNLKLSGDFSLNGTDDAITLLYTGSYWVEVSTANNA